jgi:U3 small nucleolar RNA-associated protein 20
MSSSLVASYFASVEKRKREEKLDATSSFLVQPSRLFIIAASFLKQLRMELSDSTANNLIIQNLAYSVCNLHMLIKQTTSSHQFWSNLRSSDHVAFLEGFELLGSKKSKNTFLLCTADAAGFDLNRSEELTSLLVSSLLKKMGKIAMRMEDTHVSTIPLVQSFFIVHTVPVISNTYKTVFFLCSQMKIVFSCFSLISSRLGAEVSLTYAVHLLDPLYKVAEDFAGKVISGMIFVFVLS